MVKIKRIYDPVSSDDGKRILIDRLWPCWTGLPLSFSSFTGFGEASSFEPKSDQMEE
jgi:hypothetical protein